MISAPANPPIGSATSSASSSTPATTNAAPPSSPQTTTTIPRQKAKPPASPAENSSCPPAKIPSTNASAAACVPASSKCAAPSKSPPPISAANPPKPAAPALEVTMRASPIDQRLSALAGANRLFQNRVAVGGIGAEGAAAQWRLLVLVCLTEILSGAGKIDAEAVAGRAQRIPRIDTEGPAIDRAGCRDFCLSAQVAHRGKFLGLRAVAEGDRENLNRRCASPASSIIGITARLPSEAKSPLTGENRFVSNLPYKRVGRIEHPAPCQSVADGLRVES